MLIVPSLMSPGFIPVAVTIAWFGAEEVSLTLPAASEALLALFEVKLAPLKSAVPSASEMQARDANSSQWRESSEPSQALHCESPRHSGSSLRRRASSPASRQMPAKIRKATSTAGMPIASILTVGIESAARK